MAHFEDVTCVCNLYSVISRNNDKKKLMYYHQAAKTKQRIKEEQMQIRVIERGQEIQVQEQEIIRKERELDATVRKPAEAEKYRLEKMAEANRWV